jgi:hypothetical protein
MLQAFRTTAAALLVGLLKVVQRIEVLPRAKRL